MSCNELGTTRLPECSVDTKVTADPQTLLQVFASTLLLGNAFRQSFSGCAPAAGQTTGISLTRVDRPERNDWAHLVQNRLGNHPGGDSKSCPQVGLQPSTVASQERHTAGGVSSAGEPLALRAPELTPRSLASAEIVGEGL